MNGFVRMVVIGPCCVTFSRVERINIFIGNGNRLLALQSWINFQLPAIAAVFYRGKITERRPGNFDIEDPKNGGEPTASTSKLVENKLPIEQILRGG